MSGKDSSKKELTTLFNEKIISSTPVTRPMSSSGVNVPFVSHQGNLVTTDSGQHLIHQGKEYGKSSECVITPAANMSSKWKPTGASSDGGSATVGEAMAAGQSKGAYNVITNNCYDAQKRVNEATGGK